MWELPFDCLGGKIFFFFFNSTQSILFLDHLANRLVSLKITKTVHKIIMAALLHAARDALGLPELPGTL